MQVPTYNWQMYEDPALMAESYRQLINWIIEVLAAQATADNNGVAQVVTQEVDGNQYTFRLTAESGFFKVFMIPPPEWADQQQPLALVFSCRDLYLVGFLHGEQWLVFQDAKLDGSGHLQHPQAYGSLKFKGSYFTSHFSTVQIGAWPLYQSYDSLVHYGDRTRPEIQMAVYRIIAAISEACRFPQWRSHVHNLLLNMMAENADSDDQTFSVLFQNWSNISKTCRRGAARFVPRPANVFETFEMYLQSMDRGVATSRPSYNEL